ncbi:anti-sigma factor family protein [Microvirga lenta]|uniref:anti-sigma factor family protein n=1 Tax=Microvirga lenta TaxID=2881337 RepID=UPI001CFE8467|nr:hypothetical protein [Microvirga lenta]MCB5174196.1 hypothetical protein [Microvirga lenta]
MSTAERHIEEGELQAYVDRRLEPERRAAVEAYLRTNPKTASRIGSYCRHRQDLKDLLDTVAEKPVPRRLHIGTIAAGVRQQRFARYRQVAVICLCIATGLLLGWFLGGMRSIDVLGLSAQADGLKRDAIAAHRFLSTDIQPSAVLTAGDAQLRRWLLRRLGAPFAVPDLTAFGLNFLGGRILPYRKDNAIALLLYGDGRGVRVTVYMRAGEHVETNLRSARIEDTPVFYWLDNRCGYVIAATADLDRLPSVAAVVFDHFESSASKKSAL